ncbi:hypothetical protein B0T11DRAFT_336475 [Plectosphaerella cucumerina]|uniref:Short chain dehydrogenase/reductase n=1 Tax=Plectosphaerella cucumerina TaxID=40658 RepID=A0A8K0TPQ6_9PEZI|nr:hypothetical protein B0T11DRAFT_336475 [Plectosphaerella cucumerina]
MNVASAAKRLSVIVTGGASGIGLAITRHFASQGHQVAVLDVNSTTGPAIVAEVASEFPQASLSFKWCDVSSWEAQSIIFEHVYREHGGRIDVVMANAGISEHSAGALDCVPRELALKPSMRMANINLDGAIYTVSLAVHYMQKNEISSRLPSTRGSIICTASSAAIYPFPVSPLYAASKAGLVGFVRSMAVRLLDSKIQINSLAPVVIETNITPDKALFKQMIVTPASTLTRAVAKFMENPGLTGQLAEIHGDSVTLRPDAEYVDVDTEKNLRMFWELGHA